VLELDDQRESRGRLDYGSCKAKAEFHVKLSFPEFAETLRGFGVDGGMTEPLKAELHSEGAIGEDHSFGLSGDCRVQEHPLFDSSLSASVLPGT
jgi:hypothetical protein